ncbi:type II toxin-antitoxin system Phd/YefM family antitoxin [Actinomyces sp. MRS3W]|uniref:type II toxin-antitoxin system Phd/YefM family antitoxin n=1 Tax=Actinomyces sp. MRS3W TaxID=2800796 RepID=UPI0028FD2EB9|nr:type II toxin-antitoxin system Phd/YefM family antitoxin [Actinomyces sp. MRS3W]MDU0349168.1 type II toxin-antitoxin system Phd/YefM family antitoxin [Actinomyces sp. MRS3W]
MNAQPAMERPPAAAGRRRTPSDYDASTRTVSLRELNQRSGRIVTDVVSSGRPVTITDRGRPVARLVPIESDETPYERLLREGLIREATHERTGPIPRFTLPEGMTLQQLLDEDREEVP